jgi:hypothetical protein
VGTWATIEKIVPVWAKGFDEPVRITYDLGLGREFQAAELQAEEPPDMGDGYEGASAWRVMRARNKWQVAEDCAHHPFPGSYPVVVTDANDWGGWRVPGAEYDRDPRRIEYQARLIASAPALLALARELVGMVADAPEDAPQPLQHLARSAAEIQRRLTEIPAAPITAAAAE